MKKIPIILSIAFLHLLFCLLLVIRALGNGYVVFNNPSFGDRLLDLLGYLFVFPLAWLFTTLSKIFPKDWLRVLNFLVFISFPLNSLLWGYFLHFLSVRLGKWVKAKNLR
jgi:hypothetical protein